MDPMFAISLKTFSLYSLLTSSYSEANIYASGVGLGASKGKEVSKYAEGFSGYVSMAKDSVCDVLPFDESNTHPVYRPESVMIIEFAFE